MRRWLALSLLLPLPLFGCGDRSGADVDFGGEELGPDRHAILSDDGGVKMGLTDRYVYFALSDSLVEEARSDMRSESEREGMEGFFGGLVERTVGRALGFRARLPIEEIEEIRWERDRMRIVFTDPDRSMGNSFRVDDRPVEDAFREEDVRDFAAAFRRVKEGGVDGG